MLIGYAEIAERASKHWGESVDKERCRKWASKYGLPVKRRLKRVRMLESELLTWLDSQSS